MSTGLIAWFRTVVPVLFLLPALWRNQELKIEGNYKHMFLASGINAIRMYLYLVAFIYTSIGNAVVLFYTYPLFVAGLEIIFHKKCIGKKQLMFMLLAFIGILITYAGKKFSFQSNDFIGMVAAIGASIGYAITVIMFKTETHNYSKNQLIVYQNIAGAVLFTPFLIALPDAKPEELGIGLIYAFTIGVIVFKLFFFGLKYLSAATATSLMYLEVVSAIILGYLILGESLTLNTIIGGSCILISSFYISRLNRKAESVKKVNKAK